jgi:RimJ/RimL family protein N-acetyltransferase
MSAAGDPGRSADLGLDELHTDRLLLRRMVAADFADLHQMHQDARVMATLGGLRSDHETRAVIERHMSHWDRHGFGWWTLRDPQSGQFLGRGGLRHVAIEGRDEVEIGYGFVAEAWGRGLATELARFCVELAFRRLGLDAVISFALPTNVASRRVMEKAGLTYERDGVWAGLPHVFYRLGRLEWEQRRC